MPNFEEKIEFPCGYTYKAKAGGLLAKINFTTETSGLPEKCPIHGSNCPGEPQ